MRLAPSLRLSFGLVAFSVSGCQCNLNGDDLNQIPDAGHDKPDAGPPPPVFPLKKDDELEVQIGGRIPDDVNRCPNGQAPGDCERDMKVTYTVASTKFQDNRWIVKADYTYEGTKDVVEASAIAQLLLHDAAPFDQVSVATPVTSTDPASFKTDVAITREDFNELAFPFFQFESGEAKIFEETGAAFCDYWTGIDPGASCDLSPGDHRMDAYFVDSAAEGKLHELKIEYHPMGFICDWKETLAQLGADPARSENSFNGVNGDPVAFFLTPLTLRRDSHTYKCFCSTGVCRDQDDSTKCLDPSDPDAVVACP